MRDNENNNDNQQNNDKMKTTLSIIRVAILTALLATTMTCIFSMPREDSQSWLFLLLVSKAAGLAAAWAATGLYSRWSARDFWISRYDRWCHSGANDWQ